MIDHVVDLLRNLLLRHPCQKGRLSSWQVPLPHVFPPTWTSPNTRTRGRRRAWHSGRAELRSKRVEVRAIDPGEGQRLAAAGNKAPSCRRYVAHPSISLVRRVMQGRTQCRSGCLVFRGREDYAQNARKRHCISTVADASGRRYPCSAACSPICCCLGGRIICLACSWHIPARCAG